MSRRVTNVQPVSPSRFAKAARAPSLRAPLATTLVVAALLAGGGWHATGELQSRASIRLAEARIVPGATHAVKHTAGVIAKVHASAGGKVEAGEVLATLEAGDVDSRIDGLKVQSEAVQRRLEAIRREVLAFQVMLEQRLVSRSRVAALEQQVVEIEKEASAVLSLIADADTKVARSEIRAPVTGTLVSAPGLVEGHRIEEGQALATIAMDSGVVVVEGAVPSTLVLSAVKGAEVSIRAGVGGWRAASAISGRVTSVAPLPGAPAVDAGGSRRIQIAVAPHTPQSGELDRSTAPHSVALVLNGERRSVLHQIVASFRRKPEPNTIKSMPSGA